MGGKAIPHPLILNSVEGWPGKIFRFPGIFLIGRRPSFNKFRMSGKGLLAGATAAYWTIIYRQRFVAIMHRQAPFVFKDPEGDPENAEFDKDLTG